MENKKQLWEQRENIKTEKEAKREKTKKKEEKKEGGKIEIRKDEREGRIRTFG